MLELVGKVFPAVGRIGAMPAQRLFDVAERTDVEPLARLAESGISRAK